MKLSPEIFLQPELTAIMKVGRYEVSKGLKPCPNCGGHVDIDLRLRIMTPKEIVAEVGANLRDLGGDYHGLPLDMELEIKTPWVICPDCNFEADASEPIPS